MDDETTRLRALLRESTELALRLSERVKRAERERDDLAATLETRTAEHALAMEQLAAVTAERDVALGQQAPLLDAHDAAEHALREARAEMERLRAELAEVKRPRLNIYLVDESVIAARNSTDARRTPRRCTCGARGRRGHALACGLVMGVAA